MSSRSVWRGGTCQKTACWCWKKCTKYYFWSILTVFEILLYWESLQGYTWHLPVPVSAGTWPLVGWIKGHAQNTPRLLLAFTKDTQHNTQWCMVYASKNSWCLCVLQWLQCQWPPVTPAIQVLDLQNRPAPGRWQYTLWEFGKFSKWAQDP